MGSNREDRGTAIDPAVVSSVARGESFSARLSNSVKYLIAGVKPTSWMSPNQPLHPLADGDDQGTKGRGWDFPVGLNQRTTPRNTELTGFGELRALADAYDLMRLVIETRKDQIEAFEWEIVPTENGGNKKDAIEYVSKFLRRPSFELDWHGWLRAIIEDVLVIDATVVYPRKSYGGKLLSLDLIDGATITKLIDATGRTPVSPSPAYQQILKGVPAVDYTTDELLYFIRNPRTHKLYGHSPVAQVIMTVNIALRRQVSQLEYYTSGNVPEALAGVSPDWTIDQIKEFQTYFDSMLSGNTAARRKMTFVPNDVANLKFTREPNLKDQMDDWLARVTCYAFSVPSTPFIAQVNRATAETASDTAKAEGLMPLLTWVRNRMNFIIQNVMQVDGVEFKWRMNDGVGVVAQHGLDNLDIKSGVKTINEVRLARGDDPIDKELGDVHLVYTGAGAIKLEDALKAPAQAEQAAKTQADAAAKASAEQAAAADKAGAASESERAATAKAEETVKAAMAEVTKVAATAIQSQNTIITEMAKSDASKADLEKLAIVQRDTAAERVLKAHADNMTVLSKLAADIAESQADTSAQLVKIANKEIPAQNVTFEMAAPSFTLHQGGTKIDIPQTMVKNEITLPEQSVTLNVEPTPIINKVDNVFPAQMNMNITSMPSRETSSTVVRDDKGDIKSTKQIEKDI